MLKKIFFILLIVIIASCTILSDVCIAGDVGLGSLDEYGKAVESEEVRQRVLPIIKIIQNVGSIMSVVVLVIIGIKYMVSSVEEKAEYKKTFLGYIIGCVIVFGLFSILPMISELAKKLF